MEVGGVARAYPLRVLVWHEVVNDRLVGRPIAVSFLRAHGSTLVFVMGARPNKSWGRRE